MRTGCARSSPEALVETTMVSPGGKSILRLPPGRTGLDPSWAPPWSTRTPISSPSPSFSRCNQPPMVGCKVTDLGEDPGSRRTERAAQVLPRESVASTLQDPGRRPDQA